MFLRTQSFQTSYFKNSSATNVPCNILVRYSRTVIRKSYRAPVVHVLSVCNRFGCWCFVQAMKINNRMKSAAHIFATQSIKWMWNNPWYYSTVSYSVFKVIYLEWFVVSGLASLTEKSAHDISLHSMPSKFSVTFPNGNIFWQKLNLSLRSQPSSRTVR